MPDGYGEFPSREAGNDPGFCEIYFTFGVIVAAFILLFLLFPRLFGFKKVNSTQENVPGKAGLPPWFWPGFIVMAISWVLMWGRFDGLDWLERFSFVPLWWGFILVLDGFVYSRNNGKSIVSSRPQTMKLLAMISCLSWFFFEYLNFFVMSNWYYPNRDMMSDFGYIFWYSLSYTTVLPAIFEWYDLLKTIKPLRRLYADGPVIAFPQWLTWILFIGSIFVAFAMGYWPYLFFWGLWIGSFLTFSSGIAISNLWTPLTPIKKGNWTPTVLIALAGFATGLFWEFWNFGSLWFHPGHPTNPNYWRYSIPYLDKFHLFSEMPILGYFGYLFFGLGCWVLWLLAAYILDFDPVFSAVEPNEVEIQSNDTKE